MAFYLKCGVSVFFVVMTIVHNRHRPHQGACLFIFGCSCCCVGGVGFQFRLLGIVFSLSFLSSIFSRLSSLWISWVTVWASVSDRIPTDPLFDRFPQALLRSFSMGEWCQCVGVFRGYLLSWGGLYASAAQWLLSLCGLSHVYPDTGRLLCCPLWGAVALFFFFGGGIWFLFPFLYCFLVYFPDSISSMFLFRWKATVGEFGNSCCRLLLFMRSHPFVRAFLVFLRCGWYLVMYTKGILLFSGLSAKRLFLSYSRAWLKYWSVSWVLYPLSISLFLKLVRADLSCQDRSWCGFLRWLFLLWIRERLSLGGTKFGGSINVSVGLVWVLISSNLELVNLFPLYTVVSKKVISCFDTVWVNLRRWWRLLAVWKKFVMFSSVAFSYIMNSSALNRTWVIILSLCGEFSIKCSSIWWRRMSYISGDSIVPLDAPMVWWYSLSLNEK